MKVLIADKLSNSAIQQLQSLGCRVTFSPELSADDLPAHIADHTILVVRSTKVSGETIKAGSALSLIIRAGAGVNTIDLKTASALGVYVANCPGKNTQAVAELVIGLLIAADRRIVNASVDLRDGKWKKKEYSKANGLAGRTLGIVGLGSIGKAVALAAQGLKMHVVAWSRSLTPEAAQELGIGFCKTPLDVAKQSDAVSVHVAANTNTVGMIDKAFFDALKEGAIFINTSRGSIVEQQALKDAVCDKNIHAALDVWAQEPGSGMADFDDKALAMLVTGTPHIGASTNQAAEAIAGAVVDIVQNYVNTGKPLNAVNIRVDSCKCTTLVITHFNKVGVLAQVLSEIRKQGLNIEEMENMIFENDLAASVTLRIDGAPSEKLLETIRNMENVIRVF